MDEQHVNGSDAKGEPVNDEAMPARTAPIFPWEIALRNSETFFQKIPNGGMLLKFAPLLPMPGGGSIVTPPGFVVQFSEEGWEHFQKEVALGESIEPIEIPTATILPPGARG